MSYIGTNKVGKMYLGSTAIGKAYLGSDLVYDSAGGGVTPVLPYDAEIEYLQSSGTQYINTGIIGNNLTTYEVGFYFSTDVGVMGSRLNTSTRTAWILATQSAIQAGCGANFQNINNDYRNMWVVAKSSISNGYKVEVTANNATSSTTIPASSFSCSQPIYIMGINNNGSLFSNYTFSGKMSYCILYNNGVLVRDFIPVRVGQVGYMYDKVSGQLFGNGGTGDFILGSDYMGNGAYRKLDYVQGVTRTISTNISPVNSQWEFDVVCDSSTTSNEVIICTGVGYGGQFAAACGNGKWGLGTGAGYYTSVNVTTRSTIFITYTSNGITMTIGNETVSRTGTNGHTNNPFLFGANGSGLFSSGKIYSVKCLSGGSFNGVPAQRISDNKNGIYDLANDVFYPLT